MIAWWPGDGNTDDIVGARHGAIVGNVDYAAGKVGSAFRFHRGGWVEVADDPIWTLGTEDFTIDLWVQFSSLGGRDPLISHDEGGGCNNKWIFWYDSGGHREPSGPSMRFHAVGPGCVPHVDPVVYHPWNPVPGQWYHVALTRSGTTYRLYLDGALVSTEQDANSIPDPSIPLMLGRAEAYLLHGLLDEVEMFDRALSAGEIHAIWAAGSAGKCRYTTVAIDLKPGSFPNSVNPRSGGVIPVAILTSPSFDAATVAPESVRFGLDGTEASAQQWALEDVDGDGDVDLILHFPTGSTGIGCGATSATLTGQLTSSQPIQGVDSVRTVGCR
jgi:hypothetical protein